MSKNVLNKKFYEKLSSRLWGLLEHPDDNQYLYSMGEEEITKRFNALQMSLENHETTVQQNRDLQADLIRTKKELDDLKKKPFFSFPMNDGGHTDFGEFYLISHAWFSFLNTTTNIGLVEVEWKSTQNRKIYIGVANGVDFRADVLNIAQYGQKIKE